jgi:hypothetical protein
MSDSKSFLKDLRQQLSKHLVGSIVGVLALAVTALLQKYGDSVFDAVHNTLGSKLLLQIGAVLLFLLGYLVYRLKARRRLRWHRNLFWEHGDNTPFCPFCHEKDDKWIHLIFAPPITGQDNSERWMCYVCNHDFGARNGENFRMWDVKHRLR